MITRGKRQQVPIKDLISLQDNTSLQKKLSKNQNTSSGILSRVLISWINVRTILQAELLLSCICITISEIITSPKSYQHKKNQKVVLTYFLEHYLIWLGVIFVLESYLKVSPFPLPIRLMFIETSWLSEFE